jgi:polyhydroxyalkanoate synthesis regulator phasin
MVETHCQRCGHGWEYTGQSEHFCTCPRCSTSVKVGREQEGEQEGDEQAVEGSEQSPTGEPTEAPSEVGEPQVLLQTENVEREVPVTDGVAEVFERVNDLGRADEVRRQEVEQVRADVDALAEQVEEVATTFAAFVEEIGGEVEYETFGDDGEVREQVEDAVDRVESGELSVEEALAEVEDPDAETYDPTEEFEG